MRRASLVKEIYPPRPLDPMRKSHPRGGEGVADTCGELAGHETWTPDPVLVRERVVHELAPTVAGQQVSDRVIVKPLYPSTKNVISIYCPRTASRPPTTRGDHHTFRRSEPYLTLGRHRKSVHRARTRRRLYIWAMVLYLSIITSEVWSTFMCELHHSP